MQKSNKKNTKRLFIKRISMLMVICYALNLLQFQISPIIHSISHILEAPSNFISHNSTSSNEHKTHQQGEHHTMQKTHEHDIIDLLDSILESSKEDNSPEETILSEVKFDKHLNIAKYQKKLIVKTKKTKPFLQRSQKSKRGYPIKSKKPPRNI